MTIQNTGLNSGGEALPETKYTFDDICKAVKPGHGQWLRVIADNPGIRTHELLKHGLCSNNHHQISAAINAVIEQKGWRIHKEPLYGARKSWAWFLVRIVGGDL